MPLLDVDVRSEREATRPAHDEIGVRWAPAPVRHLRWPWPTVLAAAVVAVGLVVRVVAPSAMWLDEAQSLAIADLPLPRLLDALRTDGAPPLWYLLLHGWVRLVGRDPLAVRLLPMLLGVAAVPLAWRVGGTLGGRRVAAAFTVLLATSPFAIRYSSEARMYSLLVVLVLLGLGLVLDERAPLDRRRLLALTAVTGALLLTHYWSALLVAATLAALVVDGVRRPAARARARRLVLAIAAGGLLFLPWVPSFLHQLAHTGAPWGGPPGASIVESALRGFAGGGDGGSLLAIVLLLALGVGVGLPFLLEGRRSRPTLPAVLVAVSLATLLLGAGALEASSDGFAPRHATVVLPPLLLAVAVATRELRPRAAVALVGGMAVLGLVVAVPAAGADRTQAPAIAAVLRARVQPGDVVAACPDQLTPALSLLLEPQLRPQRTLPEGSPPERVDWTGYADRVRAVSPVELAQALHAEAGAGTVWLVSSPNYVGVGRRCAAVQRELRRLRPETERAVRLRPAVFENAALWRAPAPAG